MPPNCSWLACRLHHVANDFDHLRQPFHGEILALDGHEYLGRAAQGRSGQRPERRRAVDQHEIVGVEAGRSGVRAAGPIGADRRGSAARRRGSSGCRAAVRAAGRRSASTPWRIGRALRPADGCRSAAGPGRWWRCTADRDRPAASVRPIGPARRPDSRRWSSCPRRLSDWPRKRSEPQTASLPAPKTIVERISIRSLRTRPIRSGGRTAIRRNGMNSVLR